MLMLLQVVVWNGFGVVGDVRCFLLVVQVEVLVAMVDLAAVRMMVAGVRRTLEMRLATDFLLVVRFLFLGNVDC